MSSHTQKTIEKNILKMLSGRALQTAKLLFSDEEAQYLQDYANTVSIKRLHYNDHGPVHMRKVLYNSLRLLDLLNRAGVKFSLENEGIGTFEDSKIAVLMAAFLHDVGMSVGRENHEVAGSILAMPIIERFLDTLYKDKPGTKVVLRSLIIEGMIRHMGTTNIHSLEAGIILVADGCDMERGRARIPMLLNKESEVGDIHKYSSSSIKKVSIDKGDKKPIRITVTMTESVGFFQVEEVLMPKIEASSIKSYIELYAGIDGQDLKKYL
jgi:metal-dependent HD superfamily phosphatase/phosphodiesterase